MNFNFRSMIFSVGGVMLVGVAQATSRSSFLDSDSYSGMTFVSNPGGLTTVASLGSNPTFTIGANTYHITSIIGFYALSDNNDLTVTNSNFTGNFGPWSTDNNNSGPGGIAGWKSNPNNGITLNHSETFTFQALSTNLVDRIGLHVATREFFPGTTGNTGNISIVPEPASFAILGLGLIGIVSRRRKK